MYIRITEENATDELQANAKLVHCNSILTENELEEMDELFLVAIQRVEHGGIFIENHLLPDSSVPTTFPRYERVFFTNGHWWVRK